MKPSPNDGWPKLAEAIINHGILEGDTEFLKSDWCDVLRAIASYKDNKNAHVDIQNNRYIRGILNGLY